MTDDIENKILRVSIKDIEPGTLITSDENGIPLWKLPPKKEEKEKS